MNQPLATLITGGLSHPSKMPCAAFSLPTRSCLRGSKLAAIEGTVCSVCYADGRGNYRFPNVQRTLDRRLEALNQAVTHHPTNWVEAMAYLISNEGRQYFTWHDSGDLQSKAHAEMCAEVARRTPDVKHWLRTRERKLVADLVVPDNMIVRLSADKIDQRPPSKWVHTATVHWHQPAPKGSHVCPAPQQGNKCGTCRACWDKDVTNVSYKKH